MKFNLPGIYSASLGSTAWFSRLEFIRTCKEAKEEGLSKQPVQWKQWNPRNILQMSKAACFGDAFSLPRGY